MIIHMIASDMFQMRFGRFALFYVFCLVVWIRLTTAEETCAVGVNFCFDDNFMTPPMNDDNEYYIKPDGMPAANFMWKSSIFSTGSPIEKIESRRDGKKIRSLKFTEYPPSGEQDGASFQIGADINDAGAGDKVTIYLDSDEYLTYLELEGDDDKLCKFYFKTNKNNEYNLGAGSCGGSNKGVTNLASGIIVGVFGNADMGGRDGYIYMFGLFFMHPIENIFISTASIDETGYPPYSKNIQAWTFDRLTYTTDYTAPISYEGNTSYSYYNEYQSSSFTSLAVNVKAEYKYDKVTTSFSAEGSLEYYWDLSTSTFESESGSNAESISYSSTVCCPAGYKCTIYANQPYGQIPLGSSNAEVKNVVTLATRAQFEYFNYPLYWGDSGDGNTIEVIMYMYPNPYEYTPDETDPFNACAAVEQSESSSKDVRRASVKPQPYSFIMETQLEKGIDLLSHSMKRQIKSRALKLLNAQGIKGDIDVDALLEPLFKVSKVPEGTNVQSTITGSGFVTYKFNS